MTRIHLHNGINRKPPFMESITPSNG